MNIRLEKYRGQSTRFTCPKCGKKHSFTRYIDTDTNTYIDERVGICNRAIKCGYHLSPKQFFLMVNDKGLMVNDKCLMVNDKGLTTNHSPLTTNHSPLTIDNKYLREVLCKKSNFLRFLLGRFPYEEVQRVMSEYFIGGTKEEKVVFWQVDRNMRVRSGKIIQYDAVTGKRVRDKQPVTWVHSELKKRGLLPEDWQLTQCLFGEHLLVKYPHRPVMLVEGEKTAVVMSLFHPCFNWLATGGLHNLSREKIYPIRNSKIVAFPDLKCFEKWNIKAGEINRQIGSKIVVSPLLELNSTASQKEKGWDLADFYLEDKSQENQGEVFFNKKNDC